MHEANHETNPCNLGPTFGARKLHNNDGANSRTGSGITSLVFSKIPIGLHKTTSTVVYQHCRHLRSTSPNPLSNPLSKKRFSEGARGGGTYHTCKRRGTHIPNPTPRSLTSNAKRHWLASMTPFVSRLSDAARHACEIRSARLSTRGPRVCSTGMGPRQVIPACVCVCACVRKQAEE